MIAFELLTLAGPLSAVNEYEALSVILETTSLIGCQNSSSWAFHAVETFQVGSHLALRLFPSLLEPS